ncbi:hypothetical protein Glove_606g19 [Diversispora epigaea]|uniref:HMG box domain-containing protein n=1 Tax=Diversispora epigaea TaxID=1348612 RepID=A0A397GFF2_9GLOM|nr:hypothetical protein Glove_606g19 [Diversispora epigaea]
MAYQVSQPPKDNTSSEITNNDETRVLQRNTQANQLIWGLTNVPFPPKLTEEDLIKPRNDFSGKQKVPNKFFIYRKWYTKCLTHNNKKNDQTSISPQISIQWRNEPQEVKDYYGALSKRASELFIERYGKRGIEGKIRKNKKKSKKITNKGLSEIKLKIKEENPNSTVMFEPPHQQQHLSNNIAASAFPSDQSPLSLSLFHLPLERPILLINQHPLEPSFFQHQESSESSYPSSESSESSSTSQSSEQFEMADAFDYYHTNTNNTMNHENNNIFDIDTDTIYLDPGFTGFLENNTMYEGQDGLTEIFFNGGQVGQVEQVIEY